MIVIGLDPGLRRYGLAVVDVAAWRAIDADCFSSAGLEDEHKTEGRNRRCEEMHRWLAGWIKAYRPAGIVAERASYPRGANGMISMAMAWGVTMATLAGEGVELVGTVTPTDLKKAVTGCPDRASWTEARLEADVYANLPGSREMLSAFNKTDREHPRDAFAVILASRLTDIL